MLAMALSALCALIVGFTHKKRSEALLAEAETETSAELAGSLKQKAEKESRKSRFWFWISGLAAVGVVVMLVILSSM